MTPEVEYNIYEVDEYFKKEISSIKTQLVASVKNGEINPKDAREKLDMYLNMKKYIEACVGMAEYEKFLGDKGFSAMYIHAKDEEKSKGSNQLKKALAKL